MTLAAAPCHHSGSGRHNNHNNEPRDASWH
ncbi:hypothetical protein E2C01_056600 [Portunus trituberculatus]|uniref:Uncharacterized protein n=1 Tax=Portunus trituberculatus TaxID=210409 RepID=A0A5B7GYP0_PORTR|nr:hypothetical protein [Portunus trituberculatus]